MIPRNGGQWEQKNEISGGVFFHAVVMGRDIQVVLPPKVEPALTGLPRPTSVFTGRERALQDLLGSVRPDSPGRESPVAAVAGMPGVGKTELVLHAAARAFNELGWFPGGVLFVDMYGYDPARRLTAGEALAGWLKAIGIPGEQIPDSTQDRARLWRSVLAAFAQEHRRLLLVIDNADTEDQVVPLLPGEAQASVIVTSRHTLDIDARLHELDILGSAASASLIEEVIAHRRGPDDPRLGATTPAMYELVAVCAGLPLALRIVAALLADRPQLQPAHLASRLRDEQSRLDGLTRQQAAVRSTFDLSYQHLTAAQARLFRLLPINPGPDIATASVAELAALPGNEVIRLLEDLFRAHLITEPVADRWGMHDLIRLHAAEQPPAHADEVDGARRRLFGYYRDTAQSAKDRLRTSATADGNTFRGREDALDWLDAEHVNLVVVCLSAADFRLPELAVELAFALFDFLSTRRHFTDWLNVASLARDLSQASGDQLSEGYGWLNVGEAQYRMFRFDEAIDAGQHALRILKALGAAGGEARAWAGLGRSFCEVRRFDDSVDCLLRAQRHFREAGNLKSEATAWSYLGIAFLAARRFDEAIDAYMQSGDLYNRAGDRHGAAAVWTSLGEALIEVRWHREAITVYRRAADIFHEIGDQHAEGYALNGLATALRQVRRFDEALATWSRARELLQRTGDRHGEGLLLNAMANALGDVHRAEEAIVAHTEAMEIFAATGDRHSEVMALANLGASLEEAHRYEEAVAVQTRALAIYRRLGDRHSEARALNNLGNALAGQDRHDEAIEAQRSSREIYRELGDQHGEGIALTSLGLALAAADRPDEAVAAHSEARRIYEQLGDLREQALASTNIGLALSTTDRVQEAFDALTRSRDIFAQIGDRDAEGTAIAGISTVLARSGRLGAAIPYARQAVQAFTEAGNQRRAESAHEWLEVLLKHAPGGD